MLFRVVRTRSTRKNLSSLSFTHPDNGHFMFVRMCVCLSIYVGYCIYCLLRFTRHLPPPLQSGNTFQAPRSDRLRVGVDCREKDCPQPVSSCPSYFVYWSARLSEPPLLLPYCLVLIMASVLPILRCRSSRKNGEASSAHSMFVQHQGSIFLSSLSCEKKGRGDTIYPDVC